MKLHAAVINITELQEYLDKYQERIKFLLPCNYMSSASKIVIVIDVE